MSEIRITHLGATALIVHLGGRIDRALSRRIASLVTHLTDTSGIVDAVPSYTTLMVLFDPAATDGDAVAARVTGWWRDSLDDPDTDDPNAREVEIPVVYDGDAGPDLADVAQRAGIDADEVVQRHNEAVYTVGALGFAPGFAFLIGLPPELATPRRAAPRTRVPPGSVGIGGAQTGIYSLPTPGGWNLIGRTPRRMFDPDASGADALRPGDRVRFRAIPGDGVTFPEATSDRSPSFPADLEIVTPGVQTTVQDLGRPGQGGLGITPGGAMDRSALIAGNRRLGNPDGAAALEWTLVPPTLRVARSSTLVFTGADPGWSVGGRPASIGIPVRAEPGDELRAVRVPAPRGARGYVCLAGGIDVPIVRESRALDLSAGFGGGYGRPLRAGDILPIGAGAIAVADDLHSDNLHADHQAVDPSGMPFRVLRGPQANRFDADAWATFLTAPFTVDAQSNRMGLRLIGPAVVPRDGGDVISEGMVTGTVQVTGSGQPIVLLPGRATIGGYTRIATVIEADHDRLGQLPPGATLRFAEVTREDARHASAEAVPSIHGGTAATTAAAATTLDGSMEDTMDDDLAEWSPRGVIAVLRELARQDVRAFSLRVESAGLDLMVDRGGALPDRSVPPSPTVPRPAPPASPSVPQDHTIVAPMLGIFYRRASPDADPFVAEGDTIAPGDTVGLIEVMKTFHEVPATTGGRIDRVLVEDGATVEFGTPLMTFIPEERRP